MRSLLIRDLVLSLLSLGAFALDAALRDASGGVVATAVAVVAGASAALVGFLVHEWGHLVGALATDSTVHFPRHVASVFLFHFDTRANDRRQFLAMSIGGFAASALVLAVLLLALPLHALSGKIALALASLGVLATVLLEVPTFVRVLRGAPLPRGAVYEPIEPS